MEAEEEDEKGGCRICECKCGKCVFPQRYVMISLMVMCVTVAYMQRVCLSLAIVKMVPPVEAHVTHPECKAYSFEWNKEGNTTDNNTQNTINDEVFDWDESVQNYILLSFYFGYLLGNIPAGVLTDRFGARLFLLGGMALSTICTCVLPVLAYYTHWSILIVARVITGLGQSVIFPGICTLISRWILEKNKNTVGCIVMNSFAVGTIIGNLFTGYIIKWTNTWRWVYILFGALGVVWLLLFYFYVYSSPDSHPHLPSKERKLLAEIPKPVRLPIPVKNILTDLAVWSFIICQFGNDYILYVFMTNIPKYFADVLNIDVATTGTMLTFPPIACFVGSLTFGPIGDFLMAKGMKKIYYRIFATLVAVPLAAICILMVSVSHCNLVLVNVFVCLTMFCKAAFYSGAGIVALDVSLNFSGIILGLGNASGSLAGMVAPLLISNMAHDATLQQWFLVNVIAAIISIVTVIPYLFFVKGYRKDWDYPEGEKPDNQEDANVSSVKRVLCCHRLV